MKRNIEAKALRERGFTMVEMMVVVAIIGVIIAALLPKYNDYRIQSAAQGALAQVKSIKSVMLAYRQDNGTFPTSLNVLYDGTAPNGKVYMENPKPAIGTGMTLTRKAFNAALTGGAGGGAGGAGPQSWVVTYTGVSGEEALATDMKQDGSKTPTTGEVHVTAAAGGAGTYDVEIFAMRDQVY